MEQYVLSPPNREPGFHPNDSLPLRYGETLVNNILFILLVFHATIYSQIGFWKKRKGKEKEKPFRVLPFVALSRFLFFFRVTDILELLNIIVKSVIRGYNRI